MWLAEVNDGSHMRFTAESLCHDIHWWNADFIVEQVFLMITTLKTEMSCGGFVFSFLQSDFYSLELFFFLWKKRI